MMKKIICSMILVFSAMFISWSPANCEAADVWVDHWNSENLDLFVIEDSLRYGSGATGKYFNVNVKQVRNGRLVRTVHWEYSKYKTDMWRYETSTMDGHHTTAVNVTDHLFEYCMNRIGWNYSIDRYWYY